MKLLVIDNYDSFVYNLVQYLGELGTDLIVYRNNKITLEKFRTINPDRVLISPGPGNPCDEKYFGICSKIIKSSGENNIPVLGVCLGHQSIAYAFGSKIIKAKSLVHGKTSNIYHNEKGIYKNLPNPFKATRYHSLIVDKKTFSKDLIITAETKDGVIMGLMHKKYNVHGVQFHPESIKTPVGLKLLKNFINYK